MNRILEKKLAREYEKLLDLKYYYSVRTIYNNDKTPGIHIFGVGNEYEPENVFFVSKTGYKYCEFDSDGDIKKANEIQDRGLIPLSELRRGNIFYKKTMENEMFNLYIDSDTEYLKNELRYDDIIVCEGEKEFKARKKVMKGILKFRKMNF